MPSYWCHKCRRRCTALERYNEGVRCGRCHEGFIEEIDEDHDGAAGASSREDGHRSAPGSPPPPLVLDGDDNPFGGFPGSPFARLFQQIHTHLFPGVATALAANAVAARAHHSQQQQQQSHRRSASVGPSAATSGAAQPPPGRQGAATQPPVPTVDPVNQQQQQQQHRNQQAHDHQQQPQENVNTNDLLSAFMDQFLGPLMNHTQMNTTGGRTQVIIQLGGDIGGDQPAGGGIFNIHGNLQDYAWGEHGLDNVLTALLNTFDGAQQQMRALRPEDIVKLPMSKVTQKQVDNGTQCTTCMETFELDEPVAKLECEHIFHSGCLKPWLARNNTCPICRMVIDPSKWGPIISDVDELD